MKRVLYLFCTVLVLFGPTHANAANLVTNGSFEQGGGGIGSFTGWQVMLGDNATFVDSSGQTGIRAGQASDGLWSAYFGSTAVSGGSSISQTLTTVAGQNYLLTFDLANDNGGALTNSAFTASIGGAAPLFAAANLASQNYTLEQFVFMAAAAKTTLRFAGYNDGGYLQLDDVAVTAVPEPAVLTLLLVVSAPMYAARRFVRRRIA